MTLKQVLIPVFVLLVGGLMLPLSYGARMALVLALVACVAVTLIGVGIPSIIGLFD